MKRIVKSIKIYKIYLIWTSIFVFIRFQIPPNPAFTASADDLLMVEIAKNLIEGNWLGNWLTGITYSGLTLSKPPGYPIYLVVSNLINIPPHVLLVIIYSIANFIFVEFIWGKSKKENYLLFILLSANPVLYGDQFSRIYRDSLILVLVWISIVLTLFFLKMSSINNWLFSLKSLSILTLNFLIIGYLKITKPDTILFVSLFLISVFLYVTYFSIKKSKNKYRIVLSFFSFIILYWALTNVFSVIISEKNLKFYGVRLVQDQSSGELANAWAQMARIKISKDPWNNYPISPKMIELMSNEFNSFNKLSPYLLNDNGWKQSNCIHGVQCTGSSGPWMQFELRDAAMSSGVKTPKEFQNLFKEISLEIKDFCIKDQKSCYREAIFFGGPALDLNKLNIKGSFDSFFWAIKSMLTFEVSSNRELITKEKYGAYSDQINSFKQVIPSLKYRTNHVQFTSDALYLQQFTLLLKSLYDLVTNFAFLCLLFIILYRYFYLQKFIKYLKDEFWITTLLVYFFVSSIFYGFIHANGWQMLFGTEIYFLHYSTTRILFVYLILRSFLILIAKSNMINRIILTDLKE